MLSKQEWDLIKDVVEVLQVVEVATSQLSGENYATMSLTLPLVHGLHEDMEGQAEDRTSVAALKTQIQAQLVSRFSLKKPNLKSAAVLSSAVDPRYRKLSFLNLVQREEVKHTLMQEAAKVVAACNPQQPAEPAAKR